MCVPYLLFNFLIGSYRTGINISNKFKWPLLFEVKWALSEVSEVRILTFLRD